MAQVLAIDSRNKLFPEAPVNAENFAYHETGSIPSSQVLTDPTLSLYCIDPAKRIAIFTRTPPEVDLNQAPFFHQAQYDEATELVSVPFAELHDLAATVAFDSNRLIFVYSTGRCGSTLVSRSFSAAHGVSSLSEPQVYSQLHLLRDNNDPEFEQLLATCTTILCAPRPAPFWAIKFICTDIELSESLQTMFPSANVVYLYRQLEGWAHSAARAFGLFKPEVLENWHFMPLVYPRARSVVDGSELAPFSDPVEFMAWMWATSMARGVALQNSGLSMFIARYEELKERPLEVIPALFEHCGTSVNLETLAEIISQDSQAGTNLARSKVQHSDSELTEERREALYKHVAQLLPGVDPDGVISGTYGT